MGELTVDARVAAVFAFALGACIGSFLNVVIWRLPRGESLVRPGSHCPACGDAIPFWANVPLVSYALLRGRCRACRAHISARYPLVEALTGAIFAALLLMHGPSARLLVEWTLAAALIAVVFIDLDHHVIPNSITLPGLALGLALSFLAPELGVDWRDALLGLGAVAAPLWALSAGYEWLRGQIGLGMGDVKLVAMLASFLGFRASLGILTLGSLLGAIYGVALIAHTRGGRNTHIPFGPALAVMGIAFVFQPNLFDLILVRP
jgi:leader peptidase (prepilin peptidase)/N-methyltransferase